ncbi:DUF2884 family protein [Arenimonas daejeonensis]|uniref:DUF2884 family protein n=1 Tax=Arenimonas daejeonensis TaxID=370777 RepID=UPI0011BE9502|nr:DUF2884 family protein [Arenimonas daejeonensis]
MQPSRILSASFLAAAFLLSACSRDSDPQAEARGGIDGLADKVAAEVRAELATENIGLDRGHKDLPKAEITPTGDLIIDGKTVLMDEKQRALALEYRKRLSDVAEAGARVGLEGAELATKAMKEAAVAVFSGDQTSMDERMKKEAEGIRASAAALCDQLPALRQAEQDLAAAVPEFAPYADMDEDDINDCHAEINTP